jgi:uncharacterized protein YjiS (DUF1127 family)
MDELRPSARRRVVAATDTLAEAIERAKEPVLSRTLPEKRREVSELARIDRQLHLADLALNQYQDQLERGLTMEPEVQRLFLAHQDSIRKLEMARAALVAKADLTKKTDLEIAKSMVAKGMDRESVLALFTGNGDVQEGL